MAMRTSQASVTETRSRLVSGKQGLVLVKVSNYQHAEAKAIYVGGTDVTYANGFRVSDYVFEIVLTPGQDLWAISDAGQTVAVGVFELDV